MTAKKTQDKTDTVTDEAGVVTSRNDNASDPTGVNPAATWETSPAPSLATSGDTTTTDEVPEVRVPIQCLAPMPCNCPPCTGVGTDTNTLSAEEAVTAAEALAPTEQTDEEAAAGKADVDKADADKAKADDKAAK